MHARLVLQAMVTIAPFHRLWLLKQNHFETVVASPEPFDSITQMTPNLMPEHIPVPKTPRLAELAIPISSIVGAFRPRRSPPPDVVIPSTDGSVAWHLPPNL